MSKLEVGTTYLAENGDPVILTGGAIGLGNNPPLFYGNFRGMPITYREDGTSLNNIPGSALVDMVDSSGEIKELDDPDFTRTLAEMSEELDAGVIEHHPDDWRAAWRNADERRLADPVPVTSPAPAPTATEDASTLPNEELVRAVLEGKTVQWLRPGGKGKWEDLRNRAFAITTLVGSRSDVQFRLKPLPKMLWGIVGPDHFWACESCQEAVNQAIRSDLKVLSVLMDADMNLVSCKITDPRSPQNGDAD